MRDDVARDAAHDQVAPEALAVAAPQQHVGARRLGLPEKTGADLGGLSPENADFGVDVVPPEVFGKLFGGQRRLTLCWRRANHRDGVGGDEDRQRRGDCPRHFAACFPGDGDAAESALASDGEELLSKAEGQILMDSVAQLQSIAEEDDASAIQNAIEQLNLLSEDFAARRMDAHISKALAGQSIDDIGS